MASKEVSFTVSRPDAELIRLIAARAVPFALHDGIHYDKMTVIMDITAVHANGCPLRLQELLDADDFNFAHDIYGIRNCLDRETGELRRGFLPRFSVPSGVEVINVGNVGKEER